MTGSDLVFLLDRKYYGAGAVPCPNEGVQVKQANRVFTEHGNMGVHGSGAYLVCGRCGQTAPTSNS